MEYIPIINPVEEEFNELNKLNNKDIIIQCPKCSATSGDTWTQCGGDCPMPSSPHFNDIYSKNSEELFNLWGVTCEHLKHTRKHIQNDLGRMLEDGYLKVEDIDTMISDIDIEFKKYILELSEQKKAIQILLSKYKV